MADYFEWDDFAEYVLGEERLKDIYPGETSEAHPKFTKDRATSQRYADDALDQAGVSTPLDSVTDPLFRNAVMGLMVGYATQTNSSREPWMTDAYNSAVKYFDGVKSGDISVVGVTLESEPDDVGLILATPHDDRPVFDYMGGDAEVLGVFADLGRGPWRSWRR